MSERLTLNLGNGNEFEMTPDNSTLYTFLGQTAIGAMLIDNAAVNHVFVRTSPEEAETASGMYFFREFDPDNYDTMTRHMTEHRYPMLLNLRRVPECDMRVWLQRTEAVVEDFASHIPDEL